MSAKPNARAVGPLIAAGLATLLALPVLFKTIVSPPLVRLLPKASMACTVMVAVLTPSAETDVGAALIVVWAVLAAPAVAQVCEGDVTRHDEVSLCGVRAGNRRQSFPTQCRVLLHHIKFFPG